MTPVEACDLMEFWEETPWPLTRDQTQQRAVLGLGWTIETEDGVSYLMNTESGFTIPDVSAIGGKGDLSYLAFRLADTIREVTPASRSFLGDAFALLVREAETRWGAPVLRDSERTTSATWNTASGGRTAFNLAQKGLSARYETPQGVELDRRAGHL
jgi:uncharacterized protein DUF6301